MFNMAMVVFPDLRGRILEGAAAAGELLWQNVFKGVEGGIAAAAYLMQSLHRMFMHASD